MGITSFWYFSDLNGTSCTLDDSPIPGTFYSNRPEWVQFYLLLRNNHTIFIFLKRKNTGREQSQTGLLSYSVGNLRLFTRNCRFCPLFSAISVQKHKKNHADIVSISAWLDGCASRSRTYDGGVKVPCLTAWRWRIMQNSIAYFPLFHKRCATFLQLFLCAVCRTCGGFGRFLGFVAGILRFPYSSMFLRKVSFAGCVFQKTQSAGGTRFILQRWNLFFSWFFLLFSQKTVFFVAVLVRWMW